MVASTAGSLQLSTKFHHIDEMYEQLIHPLFHSNISKTLTIYCIKYIFLYSLCTKNMPPKCTGNTQEEGYYLLENTWVIYSKDLSDPVD